MSINEGVIPIQIRQAIIDAYGLQVSSENSPISAMDLSVLSIMGVKSNETEFDFDPAISSPVCGKEISMPIGKFKSYMNFSCQAPHGKFFLAFSLKRVAKSGYG